MIVIVGTLLFAPMLAPDFLCSQAMDGVFPPALVAEGPSRIRREAEQIRRETSDANRTDRACVLSFNLNSDNGWVTDKDISILADLMEDHDDGVRLWIAAALGNIGPRARAAVPALEKAYRRIACVQLNATSAGAIQVALQRIGAKVPEVRCPDGSYPDIVPLPTPDGQPAPPLLPGGSPAY